MTDMRATERLLDVIEANAELLEQATSSVRREVILDAVQELRRRGDTLVRSADVQTVTPAAFRWLDEHRGIELGANDELAHAIERLENTAGRR